MTRSGGTDRLERTLSPARVEALSDAVIAIAATLLVLELSRPPERVTVWEELWTDRGTVAGFLVSFTTIGIFWVNHHALFQDVRAVDRPLLYLNLLVLATISFLPYATGALGAVAGPDDDAARAAAQLYCLTVGATALGYTMLRRHLARHPGLLREDARPGAGALLRRSLLGPLGYGACLALTVISPVAALTGTALVAAYFVVGPRPGRPAGP